MEQYRIKVLALLDELEELIESRTTIPFVSGVMVRKDDFHDLLDRIKSALPADMAKAQHILDRQIELESHSKRTVEESLRGAQKTAEEILQDADRKAKAMIAAAEARAAEMVSTHEIVKKAKRIANDIVEQSEKNAQFTVTKSLEQSKAALSAAEGELASLLHDLQARIRKTDAELVARNRK